jgi:hypothetical protein
VTVPVRVAWLVVDDVLVLDPRAGVLHKRGRPGLGTACGVLPRVATIGRADRIQAEAHRRCPDCWPHWTDHP